MVDFVRMLAVLRLQQLGIAKKENDTEFPMTIEFMTFLLDILDKDPDVALKKKGMTDREKVEVAFERWTAGKLTEKDDKDFLIDMTTDLIAHISNYDFITDDETGKRTWRLREKVKGL